MNEPVLYTIRTLSPIHIGCGEEYEPTAFVVDENNARLISFDPLDFLDSLGAHEKTRFAEICRRGTIGSIIELYKFMRGRKMKGREIEVSPGFLEHWQKALRLNPQDEKKIRQELNQFGISRTSFGAIDNGPYIPGSAIKGALRTAYLNALAEGHNTALQEKKTSSRDLERMLLEGSFETDPFRMLKVSDFHPLGKVKTKILYAVNKKKKPSKFGARGPSQILEVIEAGSVFGGTVKISSPIDGSGIKKPLSLEILLSGADKFYSGAFHQESGELRAMGWQPLPLEVKNGEVLMRLGRHSGAESVTLEKHRTIRIMQGKGKEAKFEKQATTLWLAAASSNPPVITSLRPFGWVVLQEGPVGMLGPDEEEKKKSTEISAAPGEDKESLSAGGPEKVSKESKREIWKHAVLEWRAGSQAIVAVSEGKKAFEKGLGLVPESLKEKLLGKRKKTIYSDLEVEPIGNGYRIIRIIE